MFFGFRPTVVKRFALSSDQTRGWGNFDPEKFQDVSLVSKIPEKTHRESTPFFLGFLWWVC